MEIYQTHFGVYGVSIIKKRLLCIHKGTGPYKNRFDLPGGSQKQFESMVDTLKREVLEETGHSVTKYTKVRCYDAFVKQQNQIVHHVFVLYDIDIKQEKQNQLTLEDEINDSLGSTWIEIDRLNIGNSSPVILKLLEEIENGDPIKLLNVNRYDSWVVKEI